MNTPDHPATAGDLQLQQRRLRGSACIGWFVGMSFLDPIKDAFRHAAAESARKTEEERIAQAFFNGQCVGILLGSFFMAIGWIVHVWLWSLHR